MVWFSKAASQYIRQQRQDLMEEKMQFEAYRLQEEAKFRDEMDAKTDVVTQALKRLELTKYETKRSIRWLIEKHEDIREYLDTLDAFIDETLNEEDISLPHDSFVEFGRIETMNEIAIRTLNDRYKKIFRISLDEERVKEKESLYIDKTKFSKN